MDTFYLKILVCLNKVYLNKEWFVNFIIQCIVLWGFISSVCGKGPFFIDVNQNPDIFYPPLPPCQLLSYYPLNNSNCLSTFGDPPPPPSWLTSINCHSGKTRSRFLPIFCTFSIFLHFLPSCTEFTEFTQNRTFFA